MFDESPSRSSRQFKLLKVEKKYDESDFWSEASPPTNITERIADFLVAITT
jgi:hypothetical protein